MATLIRARVCAVGTEEDMLRLSRELLDNSHYLEDEEEETSAPETLTDILDCISRQAHAEGGEECEFIYSMLTRRPYGDALPESCRMRVRKHPCGLWTAHFAYDSETAFQPEDWLHLHVACKGLPMLALHADWDFGLEKGMKVIVGGRVMDDWNRMGEIWLWLMGNYEVGYPPEEAIERLHKLQVTMEREEFDLTVGELLQACIDNLEDLAAHTSEPEMLAQLIQQCVDEKDYEGLFVIRCRVAETELWELEHHNRWVACLKAVRKAWYESGYEEAPEDNEDEDE